jgi:hypothetical protein
MGMVLMSKRELNRIDILARLDSGRLTPAAAADLLRVSERQVYRLQRRFREDGPAGIADAAVPPTTGCQRSCASMPSAWYGSIMRISARHWRLRSSRSATPCGSPARRCGPG